MKKCVLITFLLTIMVIGCNNFFHSLIPPDGDFILSFEVPGQMDKEIINNTDNTITLYVDKETNVNSLLPVIRISPYATVFPITLNYIQEAFPSVNIAREAMALYQADDMSEYLLNLVEENRKEFNVPAINKPIDFSGPVNFLVLAAAGNTRLYSVRVIVDSGEPKLSGIRFTKYDNPDLMSDALCFVNEAAATIYANARYPAEMGYTSFPLIPSFEIIGDSVEVDGLQIISGVDEIDFNAPSVSPQSKTITVHRGEESKNYSLIINFQEDKDTIRSITDFRFTKDKNSGISATAVGSIINNDNVGTINVQVYYSGVKPDTLTARFVTPGTVTVNGSLQTSDVTSNDFSLPLEYRVTSRNGLFVRTYSVNVEFISITADAPRFTSFRFNQRLNEDLVQDSEGQIGGDIIMIDVFYSSISAPQTLVPEFSAGGIVTVSGSIQVSGASAQNYSRQIKYTVTNPENPVLTRDYWVQVRFVQDVSSAANITSFGFYMDKNPELTEDLEARIDQATGRITIAAPIGSGVKSRIMIPDFTAAGTVKVNDVVQTSGESGLMFTLSVTYTVVSANGMNTRTYEVIVRELSSPIFVNINAAGMNDGTNWTDAFISLQAACEAASFFPDTTDVEIWIAAGTYKPSAIGNPEEYFLISPNTSYIGGFEGWETSKEQRINPTANKPVISGDLGGGIRSWNLFGSFDGFDSKTINGNLFFENLEFTTAGVDLTIDNFLDFYPFRRGRYIGTAINALLDGNNFKAINIIVYDFERTPICITDISTTGGNIFIEKATIENIDDIHFLYDSRAIDIFSSGFSQIKDSFIRNCSGIQIRGGIAEVLSTTIENIPQRGAINTSYINILTIKDSLIQFCKVNPAINIQNGGDIFIIDTVIQDVEQPLYFVSANLSFIGSTLKNATISSHYAGGMFYTYSDGKTLEIINSHFENIILDSNMPYTSTFHIYGNSTYSITNTTFINCIPRRIWYNGDYIPIP